MSTPGQKSTLYEQQAQGSRVINPALSRYLPSEEPFTGRKTLYEDRFFRKEPNSAYTVWLTDNGVDLHSPKDFSTGEFPDRPRIYKGKRLEEMTGDELLQAARELYDHFNVANVHVERFELLPVPMPVHYPYLLKNAG